MTEAHERAEHIAVPKELYGLVGPHVTLGRRQFAQEVATQAGWATPSRAESTDFLVAFCLRFAAVAREQAEEEYGGVELIGIDYWLDIPEMGVDHWPREVMIACDLGLLDHAVGALLRPDPEISFDETYAPAFRDLFREAFAHLVELLLRSSADSRFRDYQFYIAIE